MFKHPRDWTQSSIIHTIGMLFVAAVAVLAFFFSSRSHAAGLPPRVIASMPNMVGGKVELLNTVGACPALERKGGGQVQGLEVRSTEPDGNVAFTGCWYELNDTLIGIAWEDGDKMTYERARFGMGKRLDV